MREAIRLHLTLSSYVPFLPPFVPSLPSLRLSLIPYLPRASLPLRRKIRTRTRTTAAVPGTERGPGPGAWCSRRRRRKWGERTGRREGEREGRVYTAGGYSSIERTTRKSARSGASARCTRSESDGGGRVGERTREEGKEGWQRLRRLFFFFVAARGRR